MKKVGIDLGHFKSDSGAVANGFKEVDLNYSIGIFVGTALKRNNVNVTYFQGSLNDRTNAENKLSLDCFVSVHNNAGGGDGTEIYHYAPSSRGKALSTCILNEVVSQGLNNSRGIKTANFHVLKKTKSVACLVECAFMDTIDIQAIDEEHEREAFGEAIAKGICNYLQIPYVKEEKPQPPSPSNKFYRVCIGSYNDYHNAQKAVKDAENKGYKPFIAVYEK